MHETTFADPLADAALEDHETTIETTGEPLPDLELAGELTPVGWEPPRHLRKHSATMPFKDWLAEGVKLRGRHFATLFGIGDWLNYGARVYGETYAQAEVVTGYKPEFLADLKWIAGKVPKSRRNPLLSFTHHRAVASLDERTQQAILQVAHLNGWDRDQTREAVRNLKAGDDPANIGRARDLGGESPKPRKAKKADTGRATPPRRPLFTSDEDDPAQPQNIFRGRDSVADDQPSEGDLKPSPQPQPDQVVSRLTTAVSGFVEHADAMLAEIDNWRVPSLVDEIAAWDNRDDVVRRLDLLRSSLERLVRGLNA